MNDTERYSATLFAQFLGEELNSMPEDIQGGLGRALRRYSPDTPDALITDYVTSIEETITDDYGELLPDWTNLIISNHAS